MHRCTICRHHCAQAEPKQGTCTKFPASSNSRLAHACAAVLQAYVRRSALVAASQVVRHLPPARLAGALVGRRVDVQDEVLVERLQWLMSWAQQMASSDVDQHCKLLAAGCVAWHMELSDGAMAVLEHLPEPEGPSLAAVGPGGKRGSSNQDADIKVQLPTVERLVLS